MTRILIFTAIFAMVLACSETEKPLKPHRAVVHKTPNPDTIDEQLGEDDLLKVPPGVSPALAASFAHIRGEINEKIYTDLLKQVDRYCQGAISRNTLLTYVNKRLPPQVLPELNLHAARLIRIPAAARTNKDRIRVAAKFANPDLFGVSFAGGNVYYYFSANIIYITARPDGYDLGGNLTDVRASNVYDRIEKLLNRLPPGKPVVIPEIPEDLELDIIILDENGFPKNPKYRGWVDGFDDAPRATDEQVAEYNRIYSPLAYDCVEK